MMMRLDDRAWSCSMEECDHQRLLTPDDPWDRKVPNLGTAATGVVCLACGRFLPWEELVAYLAGTPAGDPALHRAVTGLVQERSALQEKLQTLSGELAQERARHNAAAVALRLCEENAAARSRGWLRLWARWRS